MRKLVALSVILSCSAVFVACNKTNVDNFVDYGIVEKNVKCERVDAVVTDKKVETVPINLLMVNQYITVLEYEGITKRVESKKLYNSFEKGDKVKVNLYLTEDNKPIKIVFVE